MPAYNGPKRTTSRRLCVMLTPDDEQRLAFLRAHYGTTTDTDAVREALLLAFVAAHEIFRSEPPLARAQPGKPSTHAETPSAPSNGSQH
jgi:hypothetical protein